MNSEQLKKEVGRYAEVLKVRMAKRTDDHKKLVASEIANRAKLKMLHGSEWARRVMTIEDEHVRMGAASVVWWDFFGSRSIKERWNHLDELIKKRFDQEDIPPVDPNKLAEALYSIGYSAYESVQRATKLSRKDE